MGVQPAPFDEVDDLTRARMDIAALKQVVQVLMITAAISLGGNSHRKALQKIKESVLTAVNETRFSDLDTAEIWRKHMEDVVSQLIDPLIEADS